MLGSWEICPAKIQKTSCYNPTQKSLNFAEFEASIVHHTPQINMDHWCSMVKIATLTSSSHPSEIRTILGILRYHDVTESLAKM